MNKKVLRIILCALCAITLVAFVFAPCVSGGMSYTKNFYDLLFNTPGTPVVICILGVIAALLLIATIVFSVVFKVNKNVVGSLAMLAGYFVLATYFTIPVGTVAVWGWGAYVCMFLGLAIFIIGLWLLLLAERAEVKAAPAPAPRLQVYIEGLSGAYQGAKFDISDGNRIVFGRDASTCHVIFDQFETAVSRQHCTIAYIPATGMYAVRDMSKNGTFVNNMNNRLPANVETMQPRGTVIYIGSSKNAFRLS